MELDKKPYRIKFAEKQEFMGPERAKAKSWTLLANFADKTLLRNAVAACIGDLPDSLLRPVPSLWI